MTLKTQWEENHDYQGVLDRVRLSRQMVKYPYLEDFALVAVLGPNLRVTPPCFSSSVLWSRDLFNLFSNTPHNKH